MFEDRKKSKFKSIFLILAVIFLGAFILGYYLNNGLGEEDEDLSKVNKSFQIPNSLKNIDKPNIEDDIDNYNDDLKVIKESTVLNYITYYKACGHKAEKNITVPQNFIGLSLEELKNRIDGWEISDMVEDKVVLTREIETFCPRHFIIGVKDDYIAIYIYDENGEKVLKEKTDININILTPEDQMILSSGIIADTEDDMELKLEGFSN